MTVTWQAGISLGKMKRKHDEAQSKEKDVNNLGTKRQKTIAEVTERLKRDLQQKLSVFTTPQQEASRAESSVKHCYDKGKVEVSVGVNSDCGDIKGENNNNVSKEKTKSAELFEKDSQRSAKVKSENVNVRKENKSDLKSESSSQKSDAADSSRTQGKHEPKQGAKKEIPRQFKIHNPLGFHSWIQNIQNFMVMCCSFHIVC